jgi:hypothetical protein
MSRKYQKLTEYLAATGGAVWEATFDDVEGVLGFPLPDSAKAYPAWWANQGRSQSLAWQSAGWKTTAVDLEGGKLTFVYVGAEDDVEEDVVPPLSIQEAKLGLAAKFGLDPDQIDITIRA